MRYFINKIETTEEEFNKALKCNFYDFKMIGKEKVNLTFNKTKKNSYLREKRKSVLVGLDTYKLNVNYGTIQESLEERAKIEEWYQQLLDINQTEKALENIPERVAYYCEEQHNDR